MKSNSTLLRAFVCTLLLLSANVSKIFAQSNNCLAPTMVWQNAQLVSGTALQPGALYKFPEVTPGVNAFVTVKGFVNGATLSSIDDMTFGYSAAWQPVVKTPNVQGASTSWVSFKIEFKKASNGQKYKFDCAALSFIDVDGDGQHVREFVSAKKPDSYAVSNITLLTVIDGDVHGNNNGNDDDEEEDTDNSDNKFTKAVGPVLNYAGLDTTSYRTNINFKYTHVSRIEEVRIGNVTDPTFVVQDRYTCGYFARISMPFQVLPVSYSAWYASVVNNKAVDLKWVTAQEINNDHFEVERSYDMVNFSTAGIILDGMKAIGTGKSYNFIDNAAELKGKSKIYYRLKQVDKDGGFAYTSTLAVKLETGAAAPLMQVYPNPFTEKVSLTFSALNNGKADVSIVNTNGQQVIAQSTIVNKGTNTVQVGGLTKLQPGLYFVRLTVNGILCDYQKIVKK